jgi:hypothetical protein
MTAPHGKALAMQMALQKYGHAPATPHHIPLIEPTAGPLLVSGLASATTVDLQNTRFAPHAFGQLPVQLPLLLKHDHNIIAGEVLALSYDRHGQVLIRAELTNELAKRMGAFSVSATVLDYVVDSVGVATVTKAQLVEVSLTDRPANPDCLIHTRWPQSADVAFYDIMERGMHVIAKMAQVLVQATLQPRSMDVCPSPAAPHPPTPFAQLVTAMQEQSP